MSNEQPHVVEPHTNAAESEEVKPTTPKEQVTASTPTTRTAKNPNGVAAGKLPAKRTRKAREAQKKSR